MDGDPREAEGLARYLHDAIVANTDVDYGPRAYGFAEARLTNRAGAA